MYKDSVDVATQVSARLLKEKKCKSTPNAIMADTLYGQVWAFTLGLGPLVEPNFLISHLLAELANNDTPYGLRVLTSPRMQRDDNFDFPEMKRKQSCSNLASQTVDNVIWMGGSPDWSTLASHLGCNTSSSLIQAEKALDHWRSTLNDQWNFHGLVAGQGNNY